MMLRSMTGFAAKNVTLTSHDIKTSVSISIKSLNSRFFEATCKLPYQLSNLEIDLLKVIKNKLLRGHIYLTIYMNNPDLFKGSVEPAFNTIDGYLKAIKAIKDRYPIQGDLTIENLFAVPNIFSSTEATIDEQSKQIILDATQELVIALMATQTKEGTALSHDIEQRLFTMSRCIDAIEKASAHLIELQKEKVAKTIQEISADSSSLIDIQKHAAYTLLEKMDINEEIVRFKSHLTSLSAQLISGESEKGKRLDFTLQELAREINTIAAKCSDATIGSLAIDIKVELEKAREQVQNIV